MVEAVVSFTAQRLGNLHIQEAVFLQGVHEQVDELQRELRRMQCFLQDAEAKQATNESIRNWVADVRDVAYDSEDVIDTFILKVAITRKGICEVLKSYACIFFNMKWVHLHKVGTDIQSILAKTTLVGVGGLGKTTLAKKVYKHDVVQRHFDCFGWTSISQQCSRSDALCEILKKASVLPDQEMEATRKLNEMELVVKVFTFLKGERYLVVLDDIWQTEDWDILRSAFPNEKIGSKILFTTRNKEVVSQIHTAFTLNLVV